MANRKFLIESILGLAQKIGANPSKFMGTKSNINFLGTGDKAMKGTTFSGQLNDDFLNLGFGKDDMIKIIEQDAGYVTAGKLNDSQLNTMYNNLKMIDETFSPPPGPLNVIDLKTGTRDLNKEGLESLRTEQMSFTDKIGEGISTLKTKLKAPFNVRSAVDDIERVEKKAAEESFLKTGAADFTDSIAAEGGRRAVIRQVLSREPDFFQLPPEVAESIAKSKDLGKGGSKFSDPLVVFRNVGNFTDDEFARIDDIIESNPFDDVKFIADKVSEYIKLIRPEGLRPGFRSGKTVKGIAELLKLTNKKFGKDTLKVADDIEPSEFAKFNERNKVLDDLDIEYYTDELGDPETWYTFGMTVREADELVKSRKAYEAQMFTDYKAGRLDPKPGESGRKKFLEKKAEEAEMSGDSRLFTPDEADELMMLQTEELAPQMTERMKLKIKYPGITDDLIKKIMIDDNPQRKAEVLATLDEAFKMMDKGMSSDEILNTVKNTPRTKNASGGLAQILEM